MSPDDDFRIPSMDNVTNNRGWQAIPQKNGGTNGTTNGTNGLNKDNGHVWPLLKDNNHNTSDDVDSGNNNEWKTNGNTNLLNDKNCWLDHHHDHLFSNNNGILLNGKTIINGE